MFYPRNTVLGSKQQNIVGGRPLLAGPLRIRQRQNEVACLVYGHNFPVVMDDAGFTKARRPLHGIERNTHDTSPCATRENPLDHNLCGHPMIENSSERGIRHLDSTPEINQIGIFQIRLPANAGLAGPC
jgi:hypothetical protein